MSVSAMRAKLDAEYLAECAALKEKLRLEEEARIQAEKELQERQKHEAAHTLVRKKAAEAAERARWHVDEAEAAKEVAELKRKFREQVEPKKGEEKIEVKDIPTIVLDFGSNTIKAGFAGEDAPRVVTSAVVGRVRGEHFMDLERHSHVEKDIYCGDEVWAFKDVLEIKRTINKGLVTRWADLPHLLEHVLFEELKIDRHHLHHYPILITEPPNNSMAQREKLMKMLFDTYEFAAMYVANTSTLAMYASGNVTGLVIESGYDVTTVCCVYEGDVVPNTTVRINVAGSYLDNYLIRLLNEKGYRFNELSMLDGFIARDIKESLCEVCPDQEGLDEACRDAPAEEYDTARNGNDLLPGYEKKMFPDKLMIGDERFLCPEVLFKIPETDMITPGITSMVMKSLDGAGIDLVKPILAHVVVAGGTSMMTGFEERIRQEVQGIAQGSVTVHVAPTTQRHLAAWIGGSILGTAKNFNFHWISRDEYLQYGLELAHTNKTA
eukprot:m.1138144 g.1138144  ORF g.1138144 m.1138144 type:complete len:494 (-) comp24439_c0_seq2:49-1530(-)